MVYPFLRAERQHNHQLHVAHIGLPVDGLFQACDANAGVAYPVGFGMRNGHAEAHGGGHNFFALPEIFFQLQRILRAPLNSQIAAQKLQNLLL
ncbi:hypothetical protein D3C81_2147570 [compost metagenome]